MITKDYAYSYFNSVTAKLSVEEILVLTVLDNNSAMSHFTSITKQSVFQMCELTEFRFKQVINRLEALDFITVSQSGKERILFLTPYGEKAIKLFMSKTKGNEAIQQ